VPNISAKRQDVIEIKGLKQAVRLMRRLDKAFVDDFKGIHKGAADIVAEEVNRRVPVSTGNKRSAAKRARGHSLYHSGALKRTIRTSGTQRGGVVRIGKKKVPYAGRIIFGDPPGRFDDKGRRMNIPPNPFFYEAADAKFTQVVDYYERELEDILDRAIKQAKRGG